MGPHGVGSVGMGLPHRGACACTRHLAKVPWYISEGTKTGLRGPRANRQHSSYWHGASTGLGLASGMGLGAWHGARPKNNPGGGQGPGTQRRLLFAALALGQQPTGTAIKVPHYC
jgi:hypothetical protein